MAEIFAVPLALGVLTAIGLVTALVGDDIWDLAGWIGLGVPLIVTGWCLLRPRTGR